MVNRKRAFRLLGLLLFCIGIAAGLALAGGAIWADLEARFYGFPKFGGQTLPGLNCPILLGRSETSTVSVTLKNPTQNPLRLKVEADFGSAGLWRKESEIVAMAPGEKKRSEWTVTKDDVDLGSFIMVKIWTAPGGPFLTRESTCGILMLNLGGLTGQQVFVLVLVTSLFSIVAGMVLWEWGNQPLQGRTRDATYAMRFLGVIVLLAMLAGIRGSWLLGVVAVMIVVLMINVTLYFLLTG